jgi:hypothetical protein
MKMVIIPAHTVLNNPVELSQGKRPRYLDAPPYLRTNNLKAYPEDKQGCRFFRMALLCFLHLRYSLRNGIGTEAVLSPVHVQYHRTVIRTGYIRPYRRALHLRHKQGVHTMVIDPPSYVSLPSPCPVGPPAIVPFFTGVKMTEGIHVTCMGKGIHPGPLFREIPGIPFVFFGPGKVQGGMGYVVIPTEHHVAALGYEGITAFPYGPAEGQFILQPGSPFLSIGKIRADKHKILKIRGQDPPFGIEFPYTQGFYLQGFRFTVYGNPGIPRLFCAGPV